MRAVLLRRRRAFAGEADQIERLPLQWKMPLLEPDHIREVVDQARHAIGVIQDGRDRRFAILAAPLQKLGAGPDDCQRRAQVVAHHRQEVALGSLTSFPFADVLGDGRRADDASRRVGDRRHAHGDIDPPAVFGDANRIMMR